MVKYDGLTMVGSWMIGLPTARVWASKCMAMDLYELNNTYLASRKRLGTIGVYWSPIHNLNSNIFKIAQNGQK